MMRLAELRRCLRLRLSLPPPLPSVWQKCEHAPFWNSDREQRGEHLRIHIMRDSFKGFYFCSVRYQRRGQLLNFTRRLNVTTACESLRTDTACYTPTPPATP